MADFRRSIFVLVALALLLGAASTVSAQPFSCPTPTVAVTPLVRAEGETELVGDLVLNCSGGTATPAGVPVPTANIQIFLNTALTSRVLNTTTNLTEALLLIDEPSEAQQVVCASPCGVENGTGGAGGSYKGGRPNVFQGQVAGPNSVVFLGVPIDPPGTTQANRIFRFTNVRSAANGQAVAGITSIPTQIVEVVSVSPSTALPINTPQQTVALVVSGLQASADKVMTFQQCVSAPKYTFAGNVTASEGFPTAFKLQNQTNPQDVPGAFALDSESGFFGPNLPAGAGVADFATRIQVNFASVQTGVTVYTPNTIWGSPTATAAACAANHAMCSLELQLVPSATAAHAIGAGPPLTDNSATNTAVTITGGIGTAVYEVVKDDPKNFESVSIPVFIAYTAAPGATPPSPAFGTANATVSFAPIINDTTAEPSTVAVPRFVNVSPVAARFTIVTCATHLLFPFVTNQAGFDTGLAISNTSADPYGTSTQTGTCLLTPFGSPTLTAVTTPVVGPGTVYANLVSILFPGFQGYVFADCNFQFGHGFGFIETAGGGTAAVAQGYLALVLPDPARGLGALGVVVYLGESGEVLGQ